MKTALVMLALVSSSCGHFHRGHGSPTEGRGLHVTAEGKASAPPDEASIAVGVQTEAKSAAAAGAENARKQSAVLAAVKALLPQAGSDYELRTEGYNVQARYGQPEGPNSQPTVVGYTASNTIVIRTSDLANVGKLIDAALANGANQIHSLTFSLKSPAALREKALVDATTRARAEAELVARSLNVRIKGVARVEIGSGSAPVPIYKSMGMRTMNVEEATPVESGQVTQSVSVTVVFDVEHVGR